MNRFPDIYVSPDGKQMIKNTTVTLEEDSVLMEVEKREIGVAEVNAMIAEHVNSRLAYKDRRSHA